MRKNKTLTNVGFCSALILVVLIMITKPGAAATKQGTVLCSPVELDPCKAATPETAQRSSLCCRKVREQRPCLCGYLKDPNLSPNLNSPIAIRVARACGVSYPICY